MQYKMLILVLVFANPDTFQYYCINTDANTSIAQHIEIKTFSDVRYA